MDGKNILLLLLIVLANMAALGNTSSAFFVYSSGGSSIGFEGNDTLLMPKIALPNGTASMEHFERLPVYSINQSINGTYHSSLEPAASNISMCISPFDLSFFISDDYGVDFSGKICEKYYPLLNSSNSNYIENAESKSFLLSRTRSGMYSLYFFDEEKSSLLISMPLLITEGQTILQAPSIVEADEPFIPVMMNTSVPGNESKFFAAILISRSNYENASLGIAKNRTTSGLDITLSLGSKSLHIDGPISVSSKLLMDLLPLLPENSAVGLQESSHPGVDLILLPDNSWVKGEYILTGGIYSPGKGLVGIKQSVIHIA
ncbi:MAG: hypothetical protein A4E49_01426 [Methanosaeta sp. PtaU1.Bin112]|nr:MAG: hypothetical protein A4E49_01426 [Methanosaeta sp. PtaU1.Bin112]